MNRLQPILAALGCGACLGSLLSCGTIPAGAAVPVAPANRTPASVAATVPAVPAVKPIPKSVFIYEYAGGSKDPFFPESIRRHARSAEAGATEGKTLPKTALPILKGIVRGSKKQPLALINDLILEPGETGRLTLSGRDVLVRCLEIRRAAVVITVDNMRHELALPYE